MRRVAVTGMGVISAIGNDPETLFTSLMNGRSGVREAAVEGPVPYRAVAAFASFDPARYFEPQQRLENIDRVGQLTMAAAAMAISDSGISFDDSNRGRAGVSFGTGMGAGSALEETFSQSLLRDANRIRPLTVLKVMSNAAPAHIAARYGLGGPDLTFSCACASSAVSIGEAFRQIRHGYADVMIAGGAESSLSFTFFKSWDAMHMLAPVDRDNPAATCKPFAKNRKGLVLGEGAAMVVLEDLEAARARGARIYAELAGYSSSNDHRHLTKPSVEAQREAMALALADAGMNADQIDYINAHGTATQLNDLTETTAIKSVFGSRAHSIPVSSTKSMHGHLLGGAGALEFVISLLALDRSAVPPTANLEIPDPECDLDYVPRSGRDGVRLRAAMSNSFAFGGTNGVLIARRIA